MIDAYILRDIITDHNLCKTQKETLQSLIDKIEQGTLVDTESYFIVVDNEWAGKNRYLVCKNAIQLAVCDFCESREEAEKRLKELQNGYKL